MAGSANTEMYMAKGHGEKLSRSMERAIAALLTERSVAAAAQKAGVGERTLRRWIRQPEFVRAWRAARNELLELAIGQLQHGTAKAVRALARNLRCGKAGVEVRAALGMVAQSLRVKELMELEERIADLEAALKAKGDQP